MSLVVDEYRRADKGTAGTPSLNLSSGKKIIQRLRRNTLLGGALREFLVDLPLPPRHMHTGHRHSNGPAIDLHAKRERVLCPSNSHWKELFVYKYSNEQYPDTCQQTQPVAPFYGGWI